MAQQLGQPDGGEQRCASRGKFSGRRWLPLALAARMANGLPIPYGQGGASRLTGKFTRLAVFPLAQK